MTVANLLYRTSPKNGNSAFDKENIDSLPPFRTKTIPNAKLVKLKKIERERKKSFKTYFLLIKILMSISVFY